MKLFRRLAVAATLAFSLGSAAHAEIITNTYDPFPDAWVNTYNSPYTYTHDLRSQGLPGATVNWATLTVSLYDTTDLFIAFKETLTFDFDGLDSAIVKNVSLFGRDYDFALDTGLLSDGQLSVSLRAGCTVNSRFGCLVAQDVMFAQSVLTVDITRQAEVPEPASVLTLGAGLAGLAAAHA